MTIETVLGLSFLAVTVIGYAVSQSPTNRVKKYVDQKVVW